MTMATARTTATAPPTAIRISPRDGSDPPAAGNGDETDGDEDARGEMSVTAEAGAAAGRRRTANAQASSAPAVPNRIIQPDWRDDGRDHFTSG
ncbi:hypothetical protein Adu01nite_41410 [Paractinoplanes durhamensis]|uniref:Uncharacterized protein n=1 Tax=Paractinoplanes durhamensis TaxID=113563 RepID=A0ABQ3YYZ5_9ACTN|nr:hypothetical protein Adu01nite_41410 [Actinoplanes durhamensis]